MEVQVSADRIYRLREMLSQMAQGDFSRRIQVEGNGDHFEMIEQLANKLAVENSQKLKRVIEQNPKGSRYFLQKLGFILDKDFNITWVESKTREHLDLQLKEVIGRPFKELLSQKSREKWEVTEIQIDRAIKGPELFELRFPDSKGMEVCAYCHVNRYENLQKVCYELGSMVSVLFESNRFQMRELEKTMAFKNNKSTGTPKSLWLRVEDHERINKVIKYIDSIVKKPIPTSSELAKKFGTNVTKLRNDFKAVTDYTPKQYHSNIRIHKALETINLNPRRPLGQIAVDLGYKTYGTFAKKFKEALGYPPKVAQEMAVNRENRNRVDQNRIEQSDNDQSDKD